MPHLRSQLKAVWLAVLVCVTMIVVAGSAAVYVVVSNKHLTDSNCAQIESLKAQLRAEAVFDETDGRALLGDLNIDPDSRKGQNLIRQAREAAKRTMERFAPRKC